MYRAIPKGVKESEFRNGDWITPSRAYAQMEGQEIPGGYRIITDVVKTKDVWWDGNSICEFGYDDGKGYAYKDTRNNRKLTEVIVRDSDGAIIPPSKRFNSRRFETYYQRQAEEKLTQDEKAWGETVDNFIAGRLQQNRPIRVMTTPIALKLASDEDVSFKEIVTSPAVLKKILKDKHVEITPDILKQLPRAMADPILVFKSATVPGSYVSMLELKDDKGGTVVVPVEIGRAHV